MDDGNDRKIFGAPVLAMPAPLATSDGDAPLRKGRAPEGKRSGYGLSTVLGSEDRVHITQTNAVPWRLVCSLVGMRGGRPIMVGTGALIGPRLVLTAGHNLDGRIEEMVIVPGRAGGREPFGSQRLPRSAFRMHPDWEDIRLRDPSRDAGAIVLDEPFPKLKNEWFAIAAPPDDALSGWMLNIAGYPRETPMNPDAEGSELLFHSNAVGEVKDRTLGYTVDTTVGQSGAPVWVYPDDDLPTIVGIHAYGAPPRLGGLLATRPRFNEATRIDADLAGHIRSWSPE